MIAQSQVIAKILCRKAEGGVFTKGWKGNARGPCLGFWKESKRNTHRKGNTFYKKICRTSDDLVLFDLGLVQPNPEMGVKSEDLRVGTECVRTYTFRWSP